MTAIHDPFRLVLHYHDRTKHHPRRFARSLGYLDWATQPDPFRRFAGAPLVRLPIPDDDPTPPYDTIFVPGAVPPAPVDLNSLSRFFYLSLALSAWKQVRDVRWALRCNPSSGNLHPTEGYAILPAVEGLHDRAGVYHYTPREHGLERRAVLDEDVWAELTNSLEVGIHTGETPMPHLGGQTSCPPSEVTETPAPLGAASVRPFPPPAFLVGLSSIHWREAWKYGERAFRYCNHDTGHALGALRIAAAVLGWRLVMLDGLADDDVARLLGLDRSEDFAEAEAEHPDLIAAVFVEGGPEAFPHKLDPKIIEAVAASRWTGQANALSDHHIADWEIIDEAAAATRKPRTPPNLFTDPPGQTPSVEVGSTLGRTASAQQIIRQRRSAVAFDGRTSITADTFYHMLSRTMPCPLESARRRRHVGGSWRTSTGETPVPHLDSPGETPVPQDPANEAPAPPTVMPWDAIRWPPRIHLFLFVHLVDGLPPGLYVLARDPGKADLIRGAVRPDFSWITPQGCPAGLPLHFLMKADCREGAAQLSLGQDIAGMSAFSLGMVAEFDAALRECGPWFYRWLYWEAGLVGQVLYLEAEAAGIRSTGIGAYFDDPVHDVFGLEGHGFQSLYHFTIGGHVEDARLTTLPAYPPPGM